MYLFYDCFSFTGSTGFLLTYITGLQPISFDEKWSKRMVKSFCWSIVICFRVVIMPHTCTHHLSLARCLHKDLLVPFKTRMTRLSLWTCRGWTPCILPPETVRWIALKVIADRIIRSMLPRRRLPLKWRATRFIYFLQQHSFPFVPLLGVDGFESALSNKKNSWFLRFAFLVLDCLLLFFGFLCFFVRTVLGGLLPCPALSVCLIGWFGRTGVRWAYYSYFPIYYSGAMQSLACPRSIS